VRQHGCIEVSLWGEGGEKGGMGEGGISQGDQTQQKQQAECHASGFKLRVWGKSCRA